MTPASPEEVTAQVIARIRRVRRERGLSAQALADAITERGHKVSRETLAGAENGFRATISVDLLVHAARILKVSPAQMLSDGPWCNACCDDPPEGFACKSCGAEA